ncbi:MAG TPA: FMN-binding negative transcriptional regulator [Burkholderiaceae bacterium]|nr:FMN-binding negative transcriptional regulator [Burkholderiaceae bacterium]
MYQPAAFACTDPATLQALMRAAPLATLVVPTAGGLQANPLPLQLREDAQGWVLVGHVARANAVWQAPATGEALAIFSGAQGYVSPGWYASKALHGKVVPTWNYATVHAHGKLHWIDDAAWLRQFLHGLTEAHEARQAHPWRMSDAPEDFTTHLLQAIVGLELRITRLEGKFKLSQNRPAADQQGVLAGLQQQGDAGSMALAQAMQAALGPP